MGIGLREILIIALIVVLLFGAKRIPALMGDFAKGIKSFRKGLNEEPDGEPAKAEDPPRRITHAAGATTETGVKQTEG